MCRLYISISYGVIFRGMSSGTTRLLLLTVPSGNAALQQHHIVANVAGTPMRHSIAITNGL